ncbi:MAG: MarR family transcriptional regulator [Candidatus Methanoplasma sp.]|jgi:DNA-binding MarR family transcriptional regulator|nr:MarR family transcriptional regulator [Candidatus Methanoplasma sp.]
MSNDELFQKFTKMQWLFRRYAFENLRVHGPLGNPHGGQGMLLAILKRHPQLSQKELVKHLRMSPQAASELLSKLEKNGYITRTQSETDRRAVDISLTEKGEKAAELDIIIDDELFKCLNEDEQKTLGEYLDRLSESLEEKLGDDPYGSGRGMFRGGYPPEGDFGGGFAGRGPGRRGRKKEASKEEREN